MRPSEILAANLNKLMKATPRLETNLKIVQVSCGRLSNGKIGRVRLGGKTDIETIGEIAEVFGLQPWQLLVEDLNPASPPVIADMRLIDQIKQLVSAPHQVSQNHTSVELPVGQSPKTVQDEFAAKNTKKVLLVSSQPEPKPTKGANLGTFGGLARPKPKDSNVGHKTSRVRK
ncbi:MULTISPECIES: hypothetical protein [unclassified Polaromonas]|jgi:hypothetical protein|nr:MULTISPECIES: hypothetical protein [unclassified Polaromonas]HQR98127.1 hypothetical protein [Polaromonas sp.]HQS38833.1 hypothetical protein [Polaromonas sp.]